MIEIYTDGSCFPNPGGRGGWAAIIVECGEETVLHGAVESSTNNRMELTAAIRALEHLAPKASLANPIDVMIYSDSTYVVNPIHKQKIKAWSIQAKRINRDLWERLRVAMVGVQLHAKWIAGHNGHEYNERCDYLANLAAGQPGRGRHELDEAFLDAMSDCRK